MGEMSFDFPPDLRRLIEARVEQGRYADPADYVRDLIRREEEGVLDESGSETAEESPEYIAWVREKIAEGEASGVSDQDPFEFLAELRARRHDAAG